MFYPGYVTLLCLVEYSDLSLQLSDSTLKYNSLALVGVPLLCVYCTVLDWFFTIVRGLHALL